MENNIIDDFQYFFHNPEIDKNDFCYNFNKNQSQMEKIYDKLTELTNGEEKILRGKFNYASPVVIYLRDKSQEKCLDIYSKALRRHGREINDVYVSYFNKCSDIRLNQIAFKKEADIFGGDVIFLFHNIDIIVPLTFNVVRVDYDNIISKSQDPNCTKEERMKIAQYIFNKTKGVFEYFLSQYKKEDD